MIKIEQMAQEAKIRILLWRVIYCAVLLPFALFCGCKFNSKQDESVNIANSTQYQNNNNSTIAMPNVVNTDVNTTGSKLNDLGMKVVIKRNEHTVAPIDKTKYQPYTLPEIVKPFVAYKWNHMIASQQPPPGTPIQPGTLITLTTGNHHGAGPFRPWLESHKWSVKIRGENRCRDCHAQTYCLECHTKIGVVKPN